MNFFVIQVLKPPISGDEIRMVDKEAHMGSFMSNVVIHRLGTMCRKNAVFCSLTKADQAILLKGAPTIALLLPARASG